MSDWTVSRDPDPRALAITRLHELRQQLSPPLLDELLAAQVVA